MHDIRKEGASGNLGQQGDRRSCRAWALQNLDIELMGSDRAVSVQRSQLTLLAFSAIVCILCQHHPPYTHLIIQGEGLDCGALFPVSCITAMHSFTNHFSLMTLRVHFCKLGIKICFFCISFKWWHIPGLMLGHFSLYSLSQGEVWSQSSKCHFCADSPQICISSPESLASPLNSRLTFPTMFGFIVPYPALGTGCVLESRAFKL